MRRSASILAIWATVLILQACTIWGEHPVSRWNDVTGGEGLERSFWKEVKGRNWNELERHLAGNYFSVTPEEGRMDREATVEHLKKVKLDDFSLGDFQVELNGSTLAVTYTIALRGTFEGQPLPAAPTRMMTVWQQQKSGWMAITHAVVGPDRKQP